MLVSGEYDVSLVDEKTGKWSEPLFVKENLILLSWGFMACRCLGVADADYAVKAAYIEFANVGSPSDPVAIPSYERSDGLDYFNALPPDRDFLRVTLAGTPSIDIAPGYEENFISGVNGNRVQFPFQTTGSTGILGRTFSESVNSKVFGITLVATPVPADRTMDVILSRGYFNENDQQLKQVGVQIGIRWRISFK